MNETCKKWIALNKQHINTVKTRQVWDRMVSFHLAVTSHLFRFRNHIFYGWRRQTAATPATALEQRQHVLSKPYTLSLHIHNTFPKHSWDRRELPRKRIKEPQNQASFTLPRTLIKLNLVHLTLWLWQQCVWFCKTVLSSGCCPGVKIKVCFLVKGHSYYVQPHTEEDYLHSCYQTSGETKKPNIYGGCPHRT